MIECLTDEEVRDLLRTFLKDHGGCNRTGRLLKCSAKHMSEMANGKRVVSGTVLGALGVRKVTAYQKVEGNRDGWVMQIMKRGKCRHKSNQNYSYYDVVVHRDGRTIYRTSRKEHTPEEFHAKYEVV